MKTFNQFINEGIRDKMIPKTKEDIKKSLEKTPALTILKGIDKYELTDIYTEDELKEIKNRAKKYLNRLSLDDRLETIYDELGNPLDIYTKDELKRILNKIDNYEDQLEKISNYKLFNLYTKEELKHMIDTFDEYKRFGLIYEYDLMELFTEDELEEYMGNSSGGEIYGLFLSKVRKGNFEDVKKFMEKWKIGIRTKDNRLVEYCIESGNIEMVEYLIEKGMDISAMNFFQLFSIMKREDTNKDMIKFLISKSPELQKGFNEKKRTLEWETEIIEKYS